MTLRLAFLLVVAVTAALACAPGSGSCPTALSPCESNADCQVAGCGACDVVNGACVPSCTSEAGACDEGDACTAAGYCAAPADAGS